MKIHRSKERLPNYS